MRDALSGTFPSQGPRVTLKSSIMELRQISATHSSQRLAPSQNRTLRMNYWHFVGSRVHSSMSVFPQIKAVPVSTQMQALFMDPPPLTPKASRVLSQDNLFVS